MGENLGVIQLQDLSTSSFTYILVDQKLKEGIIIDPVREQCDRDLRLIKELGIKVRYSLETHLHADHVTSSLQIREKTGAKIGIFKNAGAECTDIFIDDGQEFNFGNYQLRAIYTPGHTQSCVTYQCERNLFTGDALLVRKCGRTDFQGGDPKLLFKSVRERLFRLSDDTKVFPGHDYSGFSQSTIGEERQYNSRLALNISQEEFIETMDSLDLPKPKNMDFALPRNQQCGRA